jgi:DNA-binding CsgD family transcriptional regulator
MAKIEEADRWLRLTAKQRACLDLLLERKTSKEIARILDVSKYTVDQHLFKARRLLGTPNRAQTAMRYADLRQRYHQMASHPVQLPGEVGHVSTNMSNEDADVIEGAEILASSGLSFANLFRDFRRRDHSILNRAMIMTGLLVLLVIVLLAGLGIAQSLTTLISE